MDQLRANVLYYGDNLEILRNRAYFPDESVDLIYLDPPFNSKRAYNVIFREQGGEESQAQVEAFSDTWTWKEDAFHELAQTAPPKVSKLTTALVEAIGRNDVTAYLVMMAPRLVEMRRVLKKTGSLYLHCDPTMSHYIKLVLDQVFGPQNYRREVVWRSGWVSGFKTAAKRWIRNHDVLLYYTKGDKFTFNPQFVAHPPGYKRRGGKENPKGVPFDDVWLDIYSPWIMSFSKEKLGYATQKPLALLDRIILASSNEGDVVLDPFCGCGTAVVAAQKLCRRWIGIDITHLAIAVMRKRLGDSFPGLQFQVIGEPADLAGARALAAQGRHQFEWWALSLIGALPVAEKKKGADLGIDGIISFIETGGKAKRAVVQVKSGQVHASHIRDLKGVLEREKADVGIFLTLEPATQPMLTEAASAGFYESSLWQKRVPKIQILTIEELFQGKRPDIPAAVSGYAKATRIPTEKAKQLPMGEKI